MKYIFRLYIGIIFIALTSCNSVKSNQNTVKETLQKKPQDLNPKVMPGNVSDLSIYKSTPYFEEGAGYEGKDFVNLPSYRNLEFSYINGKNDTDALNDIISKLSKSGGGNLLIKKGNYKIKNVILKSNIHITIAAGAVIKMDDDLKGKNFLFNLGMVEGQPRLENVKIVGLGSVENRPVLMIEKFKNTFYRAMAVGNIKNLLIENFNIVDELTKGTAIALNPVKIDNNFANICENVTVANIEMRGASIGYGLVQTNVGKNILLKNLSCYGGMTCRIEAHTGRQFDLGVDNIVIKNVASVNGKAAVLLQPHSVINGRVLVDFAKSEGSSWTLFLKDGFVGKDSKRRTKGSFAATSSFKNISLESTDNTATLSFKNYDRFVPEVLKPFYETPKLTFIKDDANYGEKKGGVMHKEAPILGASVAVIYIDAKYPMTLPDEKDIVLTGKTENRQKVLDKR